MIVIRFDAQVAVTPVGKFVAVPIPVASVVAWLILVNAVLIHNVGVLDGAAAALSGVIGCAFTMTFVDTPEVQVPKVAVIVYVPSGAVTVPAVFVTPTDGVKAYVKLAS